MDELKEKILKVCNASSKNTMMETLEIEYIDVGENFLNRKNAGDPKSAST